jgi:hypothetical protein
MDVPSASMVVWIGVTSEQSSINEVLLKNSTHFHKITSNEESNSD